ncbi:MAG: helix-turn-helix domain-containing protein [Candidatus Cloacimonadota bacterium]|nr:helix-turn-helix domain-containing protein [Candidatus Cloacimonadota bacterium]
MEKFLTRLVDLGLSKLEARIYCLLLKREYAPASEIAKLTQISRPRVYSLLSNLVARNFCIEHLGGVKKYSVVSPEVALSKLGEEFFKKSQEAIELSQELKELYNKREQQDNPLDFIQVLRTVPSIVKKVEEMEEDASKIVYSFCKPPYAMDISKLNQLNITQTQSMARGVKYRSIYEEENNRREDFIKMVEHFKQKGEEVRISSYLPLKLIIFDDNRVVYTLENNIPSATLTAMVIEHRDLAKTLMYTFDHFWKNSKTLEEYKISTKIKEEKR